MVDMYISEKGIYHNLQEVGKVVIPNGFYSYIPPRGSLVLSRSLVYLRIGSLRKK